MILVPLFETEVRDRICGPVCASFRFGALAANGGEAPTGAAMQQCKD
jgi:hypothetical protein